MHYLLIGYMFLFIHRPFEIWPALGEVHLERIYMIMTMIVWALYPHKRWIPNGQHFAYLAFASAVVVCWAFSPWMDEGQLVVENYFKIVVFYVLLVTTVHDERRLKQILIAFMCIMAIYMLHSLREYMGGRYTYRMGIARMIGVDSSLGNPNSFGASIVYSLPFVTVFWTRTRGWLKAALMGYVALSILCILLTGSRSSLLGLLLVSVLMMWRSRRMWLWLFASAVASPLIFLALPGSLQTRFETIIDPDVGPKSAEVSGQGRIRGFFNGLELWSEYPISGCGPGAWRPATNSPIESHNLIGQLVGEMGLLGAITFASILIMFWVNARRIRRMPIGPGEDDFLKRVGAAIALSTFMIFFMGAFGHNLLRFNWLWYGGFLIIAVHCAKIRAMNPAWYHPRQWVQLRPAVRLYRPVGS